jgi:hypothetical protein
MSDMEWGDAIRIAIECLRAHSIGPAGIYGEAADVLAAIQETYAFEESTK